MKVLFFKFLLNTDEITKRKQISDHMFTHIPLSRKFGGQIIGQYRDRGLHFRRNLKLIYGFYLLLSEKYGDKKYSYLMQGVYFCGRISNKDNKAYYKGIIFPTLTFLTLFIISIASLIKLPLHPLPWLFLGGVLTLTAFRYYYCYRELKNFFCSQNDADKIET